MFKGKYITDNILEVIYFDKEVFLKLYNTFEFKRLGRISHLGLTSFLYPSATHTRLSHSLGAYEITRRFLVHLNPNVSQRTITAIKIAALLHDIGHGIFSHTFEKISPVKHEEYSIMLIESKDTEINKVLRSYDSNIVKEVSDILKGNHKYQWVNQLISSEVDVDRLDYLLRDSVMTGTNYGKLKINWIILNSMIVNNTLVFDAKSLSSLEQLILARYHMNQSIYNNPRNVANSQLFVFFVNRLEYLYKNKLLKRSYTKLIPVIQHKVLTVTEFLDLDDNVFYNYLSKAITEQDKILKEIGVRIIKQISPEYILDKDKITLLKENSDKNKLNQTWTVLNLKFDFLEYQSTKSNSVKIYQNDSCYNIREISSVVKQSKRKPKKIEIGIKI